MGVVCVLCVCVCVCVVNRVPQRSSPLLDPLDLLLDDVEPLRAAAEVPDPTPPPLVHLHRGQVRHPQGLAKPRERGVLHGEEGHGGVEGGEAGVFLVEGLAALAPLCVELDDDDLLPPRRLLEGLKERDLGVDVPHGGGRRARGGEGGRVGISGGGEGNRRRTRGGGEHEGETKRNRHEEEQQEEGGHLGAMSAGRCCGGGRREIERERERERVRGWMDGLKVWLVLRSARPLQIVIFIISPLLWIGCI